MFPDAPSCTPLFTVVLLPQCYLDRPTADGHGECTLAGPSLRRLGQSPELVGNLGRKRQPKAPVQRGGDSGEDVDPVLGSGEDVVTERVRGYQLRHSSHDMWVILAPRIVLAVDVPLGSS